MYARSLHVKKYICCLVYWHFLSQAERGMMETTAEREKGVIRRKKREHLFPFSSLLSPALSLIINSNIPQKVIASDWDEADTFVLKEI